MGEPAAVVEVSYAEGWDLTTRTARNVLARAQAKERDAVGLPYVLVFHAAGRATPIEVWLVSWQDHYLGVWAYDEHGRRITELDLRLLDGRLLRFCTGSWEYPGPDTAEFAKTCDRVTLKLFPNGRAIREHNSPDGWERITHPPVDDEQSWLPRPAFGDWNLRIGDRQGMGEPLIFHDAQLPAQRRTGEPVDEWRPPRPRLPDYLNALFRPGTRLSTSFEPMTVLQARRVGTIRIPSGRLIVDCPASGEGRELTVKIPPGEYPLDSAWANYEYDFMGKHVEGAESTAVRLRASDEPVVVWEMGPGPEDDIRLLRDGHAYGFGTDVAMGSFADGATWPALSAPFREPGDLVAEKLGDDGEFMRMTDEALSADLVSFLTGGDGTYAVWVGRGESGEVTSVVVEPTYALNIEVL